MNYIEGPLGSGKTTYLLNKTDALLQKNPASSILVLCSNHYRQQQFIQQLLKMQQSAVAQLPVYTFAGFVRNTLFNYWPLVESLLGQSSAKGKAVIRPELSGLEDSELILKALLSLLRRQAAQKDQSVFTDFPGSDAHILKQIIRRLRLRSENHLSRLDMYNRSLLMEEMCLPEVTTLEKTFDKVSYALRVLDPSKQIDVFCRLIQLDNPLTHDLKKSIRHLIVDDVDETIAAQQQLIRFLAPSLDSLFMAIDVDGGSRRGYLNAYPYDWEKLKAVRDGETLVLRREDEMYRNAQILLENWKLTDFQLEDCQPLSKKVQVRDEFITRIDLLEQVAKDCFEFLMQGYGAGDIAIVLPKMDFLSVYQLERKLQQAGIPVQLLSGTRRPSDNPKCKAFLSLIQWVNLYQWKKRPSRWEIQTILTEVLAFNRLNGLSVELLDQFVAEIDCWLNNHLQEVFSSSENSLLTEEQLFLPETNSFSVTLPDEALARVERLNIWLTQASQRSFDKQLYSCFSQLLAPFSSEGDRYVDLSRIIQSYLRQSAIYEGLKTSLSEAFELDDGLQETTDGFGRWWLEQVKNGAMADTPEMPETIRDNAVLLGTPQKMIDTLAARKIYLWLDIGQREWAKSDNAPLYNAWVHSAVWDGNHHAFSDAFQESIIRARAGHITRTLMLLATEKVYGYASELDDLGFSQSGLLRPRLLADGQVQPSHQIERALLRDDQQPILNYHGGTMAISAVPGAGKTFVNVELLLELIERGVPPERIVVLTYMDSAAKTLLSRLKKKLLGVTRQLPYISTIHSLAFRILSDADNALMMGIAPEDLIVIDDIERDEILRQVAMATLPETVRNPKEWQSGIGRAIAHAKTTDITPQAIQAKLAKMPDNYRLAEFLPAYHLYVSALRERGALDFTDLILQAVHLLESYPECRERYQAKYSYIIEDEAQDSSRLLQRFIQHLGGSTPNLIRTGDTNQSITTTFSSGDTAVFREFVTTSLHTVYMKNSGRCAPEVITLSNTWMEEASKKPELENAFALVKMEPVPGMNPTLLYPIESQLFEMSSTEVAWLIQKIKDIRSEHSQASIAVLLRSNFHVNQVASELQQAKIPAISMSEQLSVNPVFSFINSTLKMVADPAQLDLQVTWYKHLCLVQDSVPSTETEAFLGQEILIYTAPGQLQDECLRQWAYDFQDFRRHGAGHGISTLIARITDSFCLSVASRSNGYLCALMANDILNTYQPGLLLSPLEMVIKQFDEFQRSWKKSKNFTDVALNSENPGDVVQVMSLHKSKGQEFDIVFMPFMESTHFPDTLDNVVFNESDKLILALDEVAGVSKIQNKTSASLRGDKKQQENMKKRSKIEEEARLVYVGLTRAKRGLFLSAHQQILTKYRKLKPVTPAMAFTVLARSLDRSVDSEQQ